MTLDRLDRATQWLGERVLSLSRLAAASSSTESSTAKMTIRRCSACHMYIDGAPDPSLMHEGKYGPDCSSAHHPAPCDHSGRDGTCQFYGVSSGNAEELTASQLQARDQVRQAELDRMASELVEIKKNQVGMDKMSSDLQELKKMILGLRPPPPHGGSLAAAPPAVTEAAASSQIFGGAVGGNSLLDVVEKHIEKNTIPPPSTQSRGEYSGPTMPDLRKDENVNQIASQVLAVLEQSIPQIRQNFAPLPTNPSAQLRPSQFSSLQTATTVTQALERGPLCSALPSQPSVAAMGSGHPAYDALRSGVLGAAQSSPADMSGLAAVTGPRDDFMDASQIMQLCTVSNRKQLRPHEFARLGRFSYASKITDKNITVPLFVMGYLQHVVALLQGVVPVQSNTEVVDRLINLMTIMEITANNSTLEDFKSPGWSIGLEYAGRIFHDIEYGRVKWEDLSVGLQPNTFLYAKDTVEMQLGRRGRGNGSDQQGGGRGGGARGRGGGARGAGRSDGLEGKKVCQSYNSFWTGSGCAYEYNNNRRCGYEHFCSACFEKTGARESHKAYYCSEKTASSSAAGTATLTAKPAVTSG